MADVSVDPECKDPKELFGQGVRAYVLQDYEVAVAALSKSSELLVAEHNDDMHSSLGEVYLYYGKSLLGLSREQNEALGDAVPKNSADDSEDEEEQDEGIVTEESEEHKTEENSASSSVNGDASKSEQAEASASLTDQTQPGPSSSNGDVETTDDQQNGEEDPTDLQVAWEVLELAKKIFQKQDDKKSLAETLIVLGEVSLESENFQSAINDIKQGLDVQKELFAKDSRTVAETLYKLGMAYSTNSQIDEAIESFKSSLEYLKNRIKTLEEMKTMPEENKTEVEEIKGLIPDIEDKIADMCVYKEETIKKVVEAFSEPAKPPKTPTEGASGSKQASDISHLVKRKRKPDEDNNIEEEAPSKKMAK